MAESSSAKNFKLVGCNPTYLFKNVIDCFNDRRNHGN